MGPVAMQDEERGEEEGAREEEESLPPSCSRG